jgi:hypothetical protein
MAEARQRSISMSDEQWATLQEKAAKQAVSTSELVRLAVDAYGDDHGANAPLEPVPEIGLEDSLSTAFGEPFGVSRTHHGCGGMVLYWRQTGRWMCRTCKAECTTEPPKPGPTKTYYPSSA